MNGLIFGIKRFAVHDGDGIRTTVFFKGCPLKCIWCHNPEGQKYTPELAFFIEKCVGCGKCVDVCNYGARKIVDSKVVVDYKKCNHCGNCLKSCHANANILYGEYIESDALLKRLLEDRQFYKTSNGGITFSGGEPLLQIDFIEELARKINKENISLDIDTCGLVSKKSFERIMPYADCFLYDLKAIDDEVHKQCTGYSNKIILENFEYLLKNKCKVEVRIPLIQELNGSEIVKIGKYLKDLNFTGKIKVLKGHNFYESKHNALSMDYKNFFTYTTQNDVKFAIKMLLELGLNIEVE